MAPGIAILTHSIHWKMEFQRSIETLASITKNTNGYIMRKSLFKNQK
jgi:hypothetical protein